MQRRFSFDLTLISLLLIAGLGSSPVFADEVGHAEARQLRESGKILPLDKIMEKAQTYRKGEVIDTELESDKDMLTYEIEILDDQGRVWELEFDATNGDLLELELDD